MGTYGLDENEIVDIFEELEFENHCEGDFWETTFILGAIKYIRRLRKKGAYIYCDLKDRKIIKKFEEDLKDE